MDEEHTLTLRKNIDEDVGMRLHRYQGLLDDVTYENLKSDFFASCYVAEHVGFEMGVKFMKRL